MICFNDKEYSDRLEQYFYSITPPIIWEKYNFKTQRAYINFHLRYLCNQEITIKDTHWFTDDINTLKINQIYKNEWQDIYDINVRIKRYTMDLTGFISDHKGSEVIKDYVSYVEDRVQKKIIYGMFTYCDSGLTLMKHKDITDLQHNRLHHVIDNGGISSIVFYDDQSRESSRINGKRGDIFSFDAAKITHNFERPISKRLHFIMSTE